MPWDTVNTNCLEGMRCPICGAQESFWISGCKEGRFLVDDDGVVEEDCNHTAWDDKSSCSCAECGHAATMGEFKGQEAPAAEEDAAEEPVRYMLEIPSMDDEHEPDNFYVLIPPGSDLSEARKKAVAIVRAAAAAVAAEEFSHMFNALDDLFDKAGFTLVPWTRLEINWREAEGEAWREVARVEEAEALAKAAA